MNTKSFQSRIRVVSFLIFLFACILILKLFYLQVIHKNDYAEKADRQYATPSGDIFERGRIFFSKNDGTEVIGATVISGFKVAIKPKDILNIEDSYKLLNEIVPIDYDDFIRKAGKINDPYEEIAYRLTKEQANKISALKIKGVSIFKESWRFYPGGSVASHAIGFVAYKGDERVGQYGLERFYNSTLSKSKNEIYVNFFAEVFSNIGKNFEGKKEGDIITTIESTTQNVLEEELKKTFEKWNADQIGGIIINPENGEIYAMGSMPNFDLNEFNKVKDSSVFRNPMVENVFEFGSVIKPLVMAGAIDMGVITPETKYTDKGSVVLNNKTINNFDKKARGVVSMQVVLDQSLNTGMVFIEGQMGHDKFREYMKSYGIGEKTGIDFPNETSGLIRNLDSKQDIDYATAAFGQGIAITPIGAARAFSVIANGGNLITPHLVKEIRYEDNTSKILEYPHTKTGVIKPESSEAISRMLVNVFDKSYGDGKYKFEHYSVATKTGTAQVAKDDGTGYYEDRNLHSFFGYFPAYNPKFLVFLYIKNPRGVNYAAQTLIPPFVEITKFLINYYNVPPDR